MQNINDEYFNEDDVFSNSEINDDTETLGEEQIVVYSRDWTIETVFNQIDQGNIDLNPKFQRRNAWKDQKKSKLIESFILSLPVPEIVLAEDPMKKKSFIVIDGKQRLLTIAGFIDPVKYPFWTKPVLKDLKSKDELNGKSYEDLNLNPNYSEVKRILINSDIRCTVISSYKNNDILYDIFYRLNTGSVPLSSQELRQVLNKGPFANYLYEITKNKLAIHEIMGLEEPDPRLYDVEFILRFITFYLFGKDYKGNLKKFLDESMAKINKDWDGYKVKVESIIEKIDFAIKNLNIVFDSKEIGRRYTQRGYFNKYNKILLEMQLFYFSKINSDQLKKTKNANFKKQYEKICTEDSKFIESISGSTKDLDKYKNRYRTFKELINQTYSINLKETIID